MYEGWHIELTMHARRRMFERLIDEEDVLATVAEPDEVIYEDERGGRILCRYLQQWDRMMSVAVHEDTENSILRVKTVIWSEAK